MDRSYRDLLKHSGVYGLGHLLSRLASVLLLPVYTRYLTQVDYGILAMLDLVVSLLAIVVASGTVRAVTRHHFESESEIDRDGLWWTGLALLTATALLLLVPGVLIRDSVAQWTLGGAVARGGFFYLLALANLGLSTVEQLFQAHLRVYKQSNLFVVLSLGRLAINIGLNLWFLIVLDWGVVAILWGNLVTAVVSVAALFIAFARQRGAPRLRTDLIGDLFSYGTPLVVASLLAAAMHQLDRYFLRSLLDLESVGIYQVAYMLGQGVNTLILQPFSQVWYVVIYEIKDRPEFRAVVKNVFRAYFSILALVMLGVSLFARPLLELLVDDKFYGAAEPIPLICLAYVLFSLHAHFNLPPLLARKTLAMIPPHALGLIVNVAANWILIPRYGLMGAALASVLTFAVFSISGLLVYRRIERYDYPLMGAAIALVGMSASYWVWSTFEAWDARPFVTAALAFGVVTVWAAVLLIPLAAEWRRGKAFG